MRQNLVKISSVMMLVLVVATAASAQSIPTFVAPSTNQNSPTIGSPKEQKEKIPVKLQIVISRYNGDRKISSHPYALLPVTGNTASLKSGIRVPVATNVEPATEIKAAKTSVQFLDIGTNIDCLVRPPENGRFEIVFTFSKSSVVDKQNAATYPDIPRGVGDPYPSIRNFSITATSSLRDGETKQFVSSPDEGTGDVFKIDVTLTVEK